VRGACLAAAVAAGAATYKKSGRVDLGVAVGALAAASCVLPSWEDLAYPSGKTGCSVLSDRIYQMCIVEP